MVSSEKGFFYTLSRAIFLATLLWKRLIDCHSGAAHLNDENMRDPLSREAKE
jgi:hypothetical protein